MDKLSCQYFSLGDQVSIEMFSRPNFGYNIDYVDSDHQRHARILIENTEDIPAGRPIRDYALEFIPTDPSEEADEGKDVFAGYICGDNTSANRNQSGLDSLVDHIIYSIDQHLVDKTAYLVEPDDIDMDSNLTSIALTNKDSDTEAARMQIIVHPDDSYTLDFVVYSYPDSSLEVRMQDAQFSAELLGLLFVTLDQTERSAQDDSSPRYKLKVGHPEPMRMGPLEYALIEGYALLGQFFEPNELPKLASKIGLEDLESKLESTNPDDVTTIALAALSRARSIDQPISTEIILAAYEKHLTDTAFEAITRSV